MVQSLNCSLHLPSVSLLEVPAKRVACEHRKTRAEVKNSVAKTKHLEVKPFLIDSRKEHLC